MPETDDTLSWRGQDLVDRDGDRLGRIEEIYLDAATDEPEWAVVHTGLLGTKQTFVPIRDARAAAGGIRVPFEKAVVDDAPAARADGQLSQEEEAALYAHYGLAYSKATSDSGLPEAEGGPGAA